MKRLLLFSLSTVIFVNAFAQPANNTCTNATNLTPGTSCTNLTNQTLFNANATGSPSSTAGTTNDVWYTFTTPAGVTNMQIVVSPTGTRNGSYTDATTYIEAFNGGTCAAGAFSGGTSLGTTNIIGSPNNTNLWLVNLTPGTTYFVRVFTTNTPSGGAAANWQFSICARYYTATDVWAGKTNEIYRQTIISPTNVLADPWEITYGPDNFLWVTEAKGYRLNRIHPVTGARQVVLDIRQNSTFFSSLADQAFNCQFNNGAGAQGGFAGMALHPQFTGAAGGQNFVYIGYVHSNPSTAVFVNRIVRFEYNPATNRLQSPVSICDTLPGSQDHNSQRMIIAPMTQGGSDYYLFYASGDMGAGQQFPALNVTRPMKSPLINSYEGKILRFALSDTCSGSGNQRWIPDSNPYNNVAPIVGKSAVWSIGMRNNQGFAYNAAQNILYGSSHGAFSDDEINIIEPFRHYGHPFVQGYAADGNYNGNSATGTPTSISAGAPWGSGLSASSTCPPIGNETTRMNDINTNAATLGAYQDPIYSAYPGPSSGPGSVADIWGATTTPNNATWHSEGWSGLDYYSGTLIPGWKNTLLAAGLKWGRTIRLKLNDAGTAVVKTIPSLPSPQSDTVTFFQSANRYRDIAFSPNGRDIYLSMDRSAAASAATVGNPPAVVPGCLGCVVRYEFLGYNPTGSSPFPSTIPNYIPVDSASTLPNPTGCVTATAVTINAANNNNNLWVPITGPNGNIIAEIDANGNNLGNITTSFYTRNTTSLRVAGGTQRYMNRNITINVQNQPSSSVSVRLYITQKELADMIASGSASSFTDIGVLKNNDPCGNSLAAIPTERPVITGRYTQSTFGHAIQFNVNSFSSFYFFNSSSTLPFELITFTGKSQNTSAKLEWVVANQQDVATYTVERSTDSRDFEPIGTVNAKDGSTTITYNFTDFDAASKGATVYYRIRANETNGVSKYTQTISVNFGSILITSLSLMPNPVQNKTTAIINATADETAQLKIIDNTGRIVKVMNISLVKGKNNFVLDISNLKAGLYYIDVTGKSINEKTKLIKQ